MKKSSLLRLHGSVLLFSLTGVLSKSAALSTTAYGLLDGRTLLLLGMMGLLCAVYALLWQQSLKALDMNVAYAHRSVYHVWSLLWAVLFFQERLTPGNLIGAGLIVAGLGVMQHE